jgi:hypothetical protein
MADDLARFAADLRAASKDLEGPAMVKVLDEAGAKAVKFVAVAVGHDLGSDQRMSRWPKARFDAQAIIQNPTWLEISPVPRNRGPMHVAEFGRKAGMSRGRKGGRRFKGVVQTAKAPRKVSASKGLHTWSDAGVELEKLGPVLEGAIDKIMKRLG